MLNREATRTSLSASQRAARGRGLGARWEGRFTSAKLGRWRRAHCPIRGGHLAQFAPAVLGLVLLPSRVQAPARAAVVHDWSTLDGWRVDTESCWSISGKGTLRATCRASRLMPERTWRKYRPLTIRLRMRARPATDDYPSHNAGAAIWSLFDWNYAQVGPVYHVDPWYWSDPRNPAPRQRIGILTDGPKGGLAAAGLLKRPRPEPWTWLEYRVTSDGRGIYTLEAGSQRRTASGVPRVDPSVYLLCTATGILRKTAGVSDREFGPLEVLGEPS